MISANVVKEAGASPTADTTLVKPYVILERSLTDGSGQSHAIKVGLIGFVPPQIMNWDRKHLEGNVIVDEILKLEELSERWASLQALIESRTGKVPGGLPVLNKTSRGDYREYYTGETRDIVGRLFQKDIEYFGYSF